MTRNPHDFERLQMLATGVLGWSVRDFWRARLYDVNVALRGRALVEADRIEALASQATWIVNGNRGAYHAKRFRALRVKDLYQKPVDPDEREARLQSEAESAKAYRAKLRAESGERIPTHLFKAGRRR